MPISKRLYLLLFAVLLLAVPAFAQGNCVSTPFPTTTNLLLNLPGYNACNYGTLGYNPNFSFIDGMFPGGFLSIARGGTATATPALVAGTNITITGTWPNQTINASASGAVSSVFSLTGAVPNLSGDVTTSNSAVTTLATVNSNVGSFTGANVTVNAKGLVTAAASGPTVYASNFAGTTWLDKVIAAATSISNVGTVIIPGSLASTASYPSGSIPTGITLEFTGGGNFGFCSLTIGQFGKIYNPGASVLVMDGGGSSCTGVTHTVQATLQANNRTILDGVRVNCSNQPSSQGITFTGGSAQDAFYSVSVQGCGTAAGGAGMLLSDQFGSYHDVVLQQNYVNLKLYTTDAQPGVSSNTFYNLKTNVPLSGVNVILSNSNTGGQVQDDTVFINHQCQNGTIACVAVFGGTGGFLTAHWIGSAPELNGGGAASIVIDGLTIKNAGAWYVNNATILLDQVDFADATSDPDMVLENHASATISNSGGYGPQFGKLATTDSTSIVNLNGDFNANGTMTGVASYPSTMTGGRGAMAGAPISRLDSSVPNAFTGNSLTPPFTSTTGTSSNTTATDSLYGTVNTVTFAGSAGSSSSNEVTFPDCITSATGVTSDLMCSILVKSTVDGSFQLGGYVSGNTIGFKFGAPLLLYAGRWTRVLMWTRGATSGTGIVLTMFPNDTAGAVVSFTRMQGLAYPTGATNGTVTGLASAWTRAQVIQSGAVNPNSFNVLNGVSATIHGTTSGVVSILPQAAAGTYNFNLPITAGSAGEVLTSQGGGSTAMTWTTPPGAGNVSNSGTPTNGQIAQWTSATVIQGIAVTGTGSAVLASSPAIVTPTIASFTNATHNHTNAAGGGTLTGAALASNTITATQLAAQYSKWESCNTRGLGDGLNAIPAGTYLQFACVNDTGVTVTITGIKCWTDNNGSSTLNVANNAGTSYLTGAITCNNTKSGGGAAGTQSATVTIPANDAANFTFVADGTTLQTGWTVSGTY